MNDKKTENRMCCIRVPLCTPNQLSPDLMESKTLLWLFGLSAGFILLWGGCEWQWSWHLLEKLFPLGWGNWVGVAFLCVLLQLYRIATELWVARRLGLQVSPLFLQIHWSIPSLQYELLSTGKKNRTMVFIASFFSVWMASGVCLLSGSDLVALLGVAYLAYQSCCFMPGSVGQNLLFECMEYKRCDLWQHIKILATTEDETVVFRHCTYLFCHVASIATYFVWLGYLFLLVNRHGVGGFL